MKKIVIGAILLLLVAGLGRLFFTRQAADRSQYEPVRRGTIVDSVYGIGTLTALRSLQIKSGVTSSVQHFYVNEGDHVKKGQRLVDLDGVGSFSAPFAGVITALTLKEGETVFAQTAIMTLTDFSTVYLSVSIEQEGALRVKPGLPVKISFDGLRDKAFTGRVESVYSSGSDFLARISVEKLDPSVLPGMSADVAIVLREKKGALILPVAALDGKTAHLRRAGKVMTVPVETGLVDGAKAEITGGDVKEGDEAVIVQKDAS